MRRNLFMLYFLVQTITMFSQDSTSVKKHNHLQIETTIGGYYKSFIGNKYIEPTTNTYYNTSDFVEHQYERSTKISTFGSNGGILLTYQKRKHFGFTYGLVYFYRKEIFEKNQDTVVKYGRPSTMRDIRNVYKYDYAHHSFTFPIMAKYFAKKLSVSAGCYFSLINYTVAKYSYIISFNEYYFKPVWSTSEKTVKGWNFSLKLLPTILVNYEVKLKKMKFYPNVAFYYALNNHKDFFTQIGVSYILNKN